MEVVRRLALLFWMAPCAAATYGYAGTWNQGTTVDDIAHIAPLRHVVGGIGIVHWDDMQPTPGTFNFDKLDPLLFAAARNCSRSLPLVVAFGAGDETPRWVYDVHGVPRVYTHPPGNNRSGPFPYPLDSTFVGLYKAAVSGLADHIASLPIAVRENVIALQVNFGASSEFCPYYGHPINSSYNIDCGLWNATAHDCIDPLHCFDTWDLHIWQLAKEICRMTQAKGFPYSQWQKGTFAWNKAVREECPGSFVHGQTEGFQLNLELSSDSPRNMNMRPICQDIGGCYGESPFYNPLNGTRPHPRAGYQTEAPLWSLYWQLLWQLTSGNTMPGFEATALVNESFAPIFVWFTQRAPLVAPHKQWAMVALRDGLDSNDTARFPENGQFGAATYKNQARLNAIAAAFAERGAREEDPTAAASIGSGATSFKRRGMNDVGWDVYRGNYGVRLAQVAPSETSVGWWRVGPQTQWFGRFGRGFEHSSRRDVMGFVLDESWRGTAAVTATAAAATAATAAAATAAAAAAATATNATAATATNDNAAVLDPVSLRVVWFSNVTTVDARFALQYDSFGGCRTAIEIDASSNSSSSSSNSNSMWLEKTVTVNDARFGGRNSSCRVAVPGGLTSAANMNVPADILLVNMGAMRDVVFHMIEVTGQTPPH